MSHNLRRQIPSANCLFAFEAAARVGNFRVAAGELNVTQPSISYHIRKLEQYLQTELFIRKGRAVSLSEHGRMLYDGIDKGFASIQLAIANIHNNLHKNLVTICISTAMASFFLMPLLPSFREKYHGIDLNLKIVTRDLNPITETANFAILLGDGNWPEFECWKLFDEVVYPVCAPDYFNNMDGDLTIGTLMEQELLHLRERFRQRIGWKEFFAAHGHQQRKIEEHISFSDHQPQLEAAIIGQGLALGWKGVIDSLVQRGSLIRLTKFEVRTDESFYLVAHKGTNLQRQSRIFRDWLLETTTALSKSG